MVPGDDGSAAQLAVHAEGAHLALQSVSQLLPCLQVPDEVGLCMVELESEKKVFSLIYDLKVGVFLLWSS